MKKGMEELNHGINKVIVQRSYSAQGRAKETPGIQTSWKSCLDWFVGNFIVACCESVGGKLTCFLKKPMIIKHKNDLEETGIYSFCAILEILMRGGTCKEIIVRRPLNSMKKAFQDWLNRQRLDSFLLPDIKWRLVAKVFTLKVKRISLICYIKEVTVAMYRGDRCSTYNLWKSKTKEV